MPEATAPPKCPICDAYGLLARDLPLDGYTADGMLRYRIRVGASSWMTGVHCGSSWVEPGSIPDTETVFVEEAPSGTPP